MPELSISDQRALTEAFALLVYIRPARRREVCEGINAEYARRGFPPVFAEDMIQQLEARPECGPELRAVVEGWYVEGAVPSMRESAGHAAPAAPEAGPG